MNAFKFRKQQSDDQRTGTIVPLVGFMLVMIFGICAFVADAGNVIVVRTTLGAAADAAALAGAGAMAQAYSLEDAKVTAVEYGQNNTPAGYGNVLDGASVTFGNWNPETHTFTPGNSEPDAVRVVVTRSTERSNAVPYFFARIFGLDSTTVSAEAIAVGAVSTSNAVYDNAVYVTSSKDLSNVVLEFADGEHQKFEPISGYTGTFQGTGEHEGKEVVGVWIKSGCNHSDDGAGYGERVGNPEDGSTSHGQNAHQGCTPHVTATFQASGVEFTQSGAASPVRLVK